MIKTEMLLIEYTFTAILMPSRNRPIQYIQYINHCNFDRIITVQIYIKFRCVIKQLDNENKIFIHCLNHFTIKKLKFE